MKIVGIVAEYNPFHKGHAYQIHKVREIYGEDTAVVCVMSGDFVQRGEPAIFSKYARAEAAVRCGADLVLELPVHISVGSAERFARGAVEILGKMGVVDILAFGSETGEVEPLFQTAHALLTEEFQECVRGHLQTGCSYPVARSAALRDLMNGSDATTVPNDNLGVEYIKAIIDMDYAMTPVAIQRVGAMHDEQFDGEMKSGSEIRKLIRDGVSYEEYVPKAAYDIYQRETEAMRGPVSPAVLETAILSRLRMLPLSAFAKLPDAAEGLERRLFTACRNESSLEGIYDTAKSKRYTHARIRRMTMGAALGIERADYGIPCEYARVLALNSRGARVIKLVNEQGTLSMVTKPAAIRNMSDEQQLLFAKSADAHDLYVLGYGHMELRKGEMDWKESPRFISTETMTN